MFDKKFFDELEHRLERYFHLFPSAERVGVLINTYQNDEYLLVGIIEYDERFITFAHWPKENADIPRRWDDVKNSLAAVTISYQDIRSVDFDPKIVHGKEIGFNRGATVRQEVSTGT